MDLRFAIPSLIAFALFMWSPVVSITGDLRRIWLYLAGSTALALGHVAIAVATFWNDRSPGAGDSVNLMILIALILWFGSLAGVSLGWVARKLLS